MREACPGSSHRFCIGHAISVCIFVRIKPESSWTNELVSGAISSRQVITFTYDDTDRRVEPYVYGIAEDGEEILRGFQLATGTVRDGWRHFKLDKMVHMLVTMERFERLRTGYHKPSPYLVAIYNRVPGAGDASSPRRDSIGITTA
jgi:hypothetical protein